PGQACRARRGQCLPAAAYANPTWRDAWNVLGEHQPAPEGAAADQDRRSQGGQGPFPLMAETRVARRVRSGLSASDRPEGRRQAVCPLDAPLRAVFFVLRLDGVARGLPLRVGPMPQGVEIGSGGEALSAVERDGLTGQPVAAVGNQEGHEVLQFLDTADPAHRIVAGGALARRLART